MKFGATPFKERVFVETLRRRATRRKLVLLECAIIRHAPFADCGRPIWDLLPGQRWFTEKLPPADRIREIRGMSHEEIMQAMGDAIAEARTAPRSGEVDEAWRLTAMNGHQAIECFEQHADGASDDLLVLAEEYCRHAEYAAEGDQFNAPEVRRDELNTSYGVASWLLSLVGFDQDWWNTLDYYVASCPRYFHGYSDYPPLHRDHCTVALNLIHDILGHPLHSTQFDPAWRTSTAVAIAAGMYESRDFTPMPILADALQDAGCDNDDLLTHCRSERLHVRGCWVVDRVLGKE